MRYRSIAIAAAAVLLASAGGAFASYTSTFMGLEIPEIGDSGPTYASNVSDALDTIDAHDHTSGKGTRVPTGGILENADHEFNANDILELRTARFDSGVVSIAASDRRALYHVGGELYWIDASGNQVQITNAGSVDAPAGVISGMTGSAGVAYSALTDTFAFTDDGGRPAGGDFGCVRIAEEVSGGKGPILCSNAATAADFAFTFMAALPGANRLLCLDASGNLTACTASAAAQALVIATSTTSGTISSTGDATVGGELLVYGGDFDHGGAAGTASTVGGDTISVANETNNTTTPVSVPGATLTLLPDLNYVITCELLTDTDAETTGVRIGWDFSGPATAAINADCGTWDTASAWVRQTFTTDDGFCAFASSDIVGSVDRYTLSTLVSTGAGSNTTAQLRLRSEVAASAILYGGTCTAVPSSP